MKKKIVSLFLTGLSLLSCKNDDEGHTQPSLSVSNLTVNKIGGFTNGTGDEGFAEISAFDPTTKKLFIVNPIENRISVWDISSPDSPIEGTPIGLSTNPNSVAIHNGKLAVAVENYNKQANGYIQLYSTSTQELIATYIAGALPDMVCFSPDGRYLLSANEGEPMMNIL